LSFEISKKKHIAQLCFFFVKSPKQTPRTFHVTWCTCKVHKIKSQQRRIVWYYQSKVDKFTHYFHCFEIIFHKFSLFKQFETASNRTL